MNNVLLALKPLLETYAIENNTCILQGPVAREFYYANTIRLFGLDSDSIWNVNSRRWLPKEYIVTWLNTPLSRLYFGVLSPEKNVSSGFWFAGKYDDKYLSWTSLE